MTTQLLSRRHFLRAAGVTVALPWLETFARTAEPAKAQRFVCVANPFGMIDDAFFPGEAGVNAKLPENLQAFESLRGGFTVFSNLDHGISGGHAATHVFLSGVRTQEAGVMPAGNITLDQFFAEANAGRTRFPVLNTSAGSNNGGSCELSWTRSGVLVPAEQKVSRVYRKLFVNESAEQAAARSERYDRQGSILDAVTAQARAMNQRLSSRDRAKLDQYLTSVREVEIAIQQEQAWVHRPRPTVDVKEPKDGTVTEQLPILFDLIALALQTDSTRVATIEVPGGFDARGVGLEPKGYHAYSHHGKDPKLMAGQRRIEKYQLDQLARFIGKLQELDLLPTTQVLFGSGMGDGSAHTNRNLPILLAGGGYKHKTHIVMPEQKERRVPLSNLYLTMVQRFGVEADRFGHSTGTVGELA
ncbi:MAG: DUF1552 domain-containing protein [Planctomycetaceae bacterium]|jgi:hypothetical protein|nr:DUF1552 domain-containing protein [Planctomycetaceae bacterium]